MHCGERGARGASSEWPHLFQRVFHEFRSGPACTQAPSAPIQQYRANQLVDEWLVGLCARIDECFAAGRVACGLANTHGCRSSSRSNTRCGVVRTGILSIAEMSGCSFPPFEEVLPLYVSMRESEFIRLTLHRYITFATSICSSHSQCKLWSVRKRKNPVPDGTGLRSYEVDYSV